jgi:hypothetical protein
VLSVLGVPRTYASSGSGSSSGLPDCGRHFKLFRLLHFRAITPRFGGLLAGGSRCELAAVIKVVVHVESS